MTLNKRNKNRNPVQRKNNSRRPMREKYFECNYCPLKFIGKGTLTLHEDIHVLHGHEPKYGVACKYCNQNFATKSGLKNHSCIEKPKTQNKRVLIKNSQPSEEFVSDLEVTSHKRIQTWIQSLVQYEVFEVDDSKLIFQSVETDVEQSITMDVDSDDGDSDEMDCQNESVRDEDGNEICNEVEGSKVVEKECDEAIDVTSAEVFVEKVEEARDKESDKVSMKESADALSLKESFVPLDEPPVEMKQQDSTKIAQPKEVNGFECSQCKKVFKKNGNLNRHELIHIGHRVKCNFREKIFGHADTRNQHERNKHPDIKQSSNIVKSANDPQQFEPTKFQCFDCKEDFTSIEYLKRHMLIHESDQHVKQFECGQCKRVFKRRDHLKCHELIHSEWFSSGPCIQKNSGTQQFHTFWPDNDRKARLHFNNLQNKTNRVHMMCDRSFNRPENRDCHKRSKHTQHFEPTTFQCFECKKEYTSKSNLKRHMRIHESDQRVNQFECGLCKKLFRRSDILKRHELIHTGQRFKCNYCNKTFNRPDNRIVHEQTEHLPFESTKFQCFDCKKKFTTKTNLKRHMRIHDSDQRVNQFECGQCKKVFKRSDHLKRHELFHTGQRFKCNYCNKTFSRPESRVVHELTEHLPLESTKFQCFDCKKNFTSIEYLRHHMRIHKSNQRISQFKCGQCKKVFNHRGHLNRHKLIHTGQRFKCNYCDKVYSRHDHKVRHERTKHQNA